MSGSGASTRAPRLHPSLAWGGLSHTRARRDPRSNPRVLADGFRAECNRRCLEGAAVWGAVNAVFDMLPVAAVIDDAVLCLHGGIGDSLHSLEQV